MNKILSRPINREEYVHACKHIGDMVGMGWILAILFVIFGTVTIHIWNLATGFVALISFFGAIHCDLIRRDYRHIMSSHLTQVALAQIDLEAGNRMALLAAKEMPVPYTETFELEPDENDKSESVYSKAQ